MSVIALNGEILRGGFKFTFDAKTENKNCCFFNFFLFGILINSVNTVTLLVQNTFGVSKVSAAFLGIVEGWTIAIVSFIIASYIIKIGYRKSMLITLAVLAVTCFVMPSLQKYAALQLLFIIIGAGFAFIKISILGIIGLITETDKEHISLMNFLESSFMIGIVSGYFIFSAFINDHNAASTSWFNVYTLLLFYTAWHSSGFFLHRLMNQKHRYRGRKKTRRI